MDINKDFILLLGILILQTLSSSCNKKETRTENKDILIKENKVINLSCGRISYEVEFPDTIVVNKTYNGVIKYQSSLDTVTTSFNDKKKKRYVMFFMTVTKNPNYDEKHLKQIIKDTFGALNNREIPLPNIEFGKTGVFYIDGIINDYVVIDLNKKDKDGVGLVREIEDEERLTHKVVVVNK
jgi:hypothetical protein